MKYRKPVYYDSFRCTAGECPDTCCAGWRIGIDEASLDRYARVEGAFGSRLRNCIDWEEEAFAQYGGSCCFLDEQRLCEIYRELGEEAMCDSCRQYPRHVEEFDGVREYSLSLSCPEAARLLLENPEPAGLTEEETEEPEELAEEFEEFDGELLERLTAARQVCMKIIARREWSFEERARTLLSMGTELQECLDGGEPERMEAAASAYAGGKKGEAQEESRFAQMKNAMEVLERLERLRQEWQEILDDAGKLYAGGEAAYDGLRREFERDRREDGWESWELLWENLTAFFVYTYFCGAVYDGMIYSKAALAVFSTGCIRELLLARWLARGKRLEPWDAAEIASRFAREVEHEDRNLDELEHWLAAAGGMSGYLNAR